MKNKFQWFFQKNRLRMSLFYTALIFFVIPLTLTKIAAPDFFKALYAGRYLAEYVQLPHHSFFTFSPVKDLFLAENFNWLGNLTFYGLFELGGYPLLQIFRVFLVLFYLILMHSIVGFRSTPLILLFLFTLVLGSEQKLLMRNSIFLLPYGVFVERW